MPRSQQACADVQVALDKRAHGVALDAEETRLIDDHVATCTTCGAFARTLEQTEMLMHAQVQVLRRQVDLTALGESARAAITKQKRGMVRGGVPTGTVWSRLHHGRQALLAVLGELG